MVYATHIPAGINILHMRCAPYRSYAIAVELKDGNYPDALVYDMQSPYHYYRTQEVNGKRYLIAGGEDHKTGHEENTNACLLRLESYVREHFNIDTVAYSWSSQYYEPADGLPYIGRLPGSSGKTFVATGFSGNGITYGTVAALMFREILAGASNKYEDVFDPRRVKPIAGFTNFVKENVDVAKELITRWLTKEKIDELAALAPGEARVVTFEDNRIALYKDEQNNLHAINPVCTHMKCIVSWNNTEQSWDCPCHGARYNAEGIVLTGPSTDGLKPVDIATLVKK
jgi:Rieske Fe-S protein